MGRICQSDQNVAVNSFLLEQNRVYGCPTCLIAYFAGIGTDAQYRQGIKDGLFVWQSRKPEPRQSLWLNLTPIGLQTNFSPENDPNDPKQISLLN